jgi:hypothetical protein
MARCMFRTTHTPEHQAAKVAPCALLPPASHPFWASADAPKQALLATAAIERERQEALAALDAAETRIKALTHAVARAEAQASEAKGVAEHYAASLSAAQQAHSARLSDNAVLSSLLKDAVSAGRRDGIMPHGQRAQEEEDANDHGWRTAELPGSVQQQHAGTWRVRAGQPLTGGRAALSSPPPLAPAAAPCGSAAAILRRDVEALRGKLFDATERAQRAEARANLLSAQLASALEDRPGQVANVGQRSSGGGGGAFSRLAARAELIMKSPGGRVAAADDDSAAARAAVLQAEVERLREALEAVTAVSSPQPPGGGGGGAAQPPAAAAAAALVLKAAVAKAMRDVQQAEARGADLKAALQASMADAEAQRDAFEAAAAEAAALRESLEVERVRGGEAVVVDAAHGGGARGASSPAAHAHDADALRCELVEERMRSRDLGAELERVRSCAGKLQSALDAEYARSRILQAQLDRRNNNGGQSPAAMRTMRTP